MHEATLALSQILIVQVSTCSDMVVSGISLEGNTYKPILAISP